MAANHGPPAWYRGPDDPKGYRVLICEDLRHMRMLRARRSQAAMADALGEQLGRHIPESSVNRWENGTKLPGADVYRAYIDISGAPRPTDVGAQDVRGDLTRQVKALETRVRQMERSMGETLQAGGEPIAPSDMIPASAAATLVGRSRQTIHNRIEAGKIRSTRVGRRVYVSRADLLAGDQREADSA